MIPGMGLSASGSSSASTDTSQGNTTVFGNQLDTVSPNNYMQGGVPAIVGGGTGISVNTPINFAGNQDSKNAAEASLGGKFDSEDNTLILIGGAIFVFGLVMYFITRD